MTKPTPSVDATSHAQQREAQAAKQALAEGKTVRLRRNGEVVAELRGLPTVKR